MAAPSAARQPAGLGARAIKVERAETGGRTRYFGWLNRGEAEWMTRPACFGRGEPRDGTTEATA